MTDPVIPREIRTIFRGRIFTVQVETIPLPHGGELEAEIIRHPGSVVIIPQDDSGGIILVRQYRHAIGRHAWELPAGSLRPHEDIEHAALRECQEETGTIPGAINVPWSKAANEDGTFKSDEDLAKLYAEAGLDGSKETIAYCRIGERSSHTWFVLRELLGYSDVKNYDGSWTEYGSLVGVPIELGAGKK